MLQSATAEVVNFIGEDQLLLFNTSLYSDYSNGVLTIKGAAGIDEYIEAINNIMYNNTADEPLDGVKTIRITVTDSALFNSTTSTANNSWNIGNSSTSNPIEIL